MDLDGKGREGGRTWKEQRGDTIIRIYCMKKDLTKGKYSLKELHSLILGSTLSWQKGSIFVFNYYCHQHFQEAELQTISLLLAQCCVYLSDMRGEDKSSICSRLEIYPMVCYHESFLFRLFFIYFKLLCILFFIEPFLALF